jgi:hypothetical protein
LDGFLHGNRADENANPDDNDEVRCSLKKEINTYHCGKGEHHHDRMLHVDPFSMRCCFRTDEAGRNRTGRVDSFPSLSVRISFKGSMYRSDHQLLDELKSVRE